LNQPDLRLTNCALAFNPRWLRTAIRHTLVFGSAAVLAIVISGGIFTFTPLIGVSLAHTQGVSMEPKHRQGDVVLVKKISGDQAGVGEVVVFNDGASKVMHRVIERYTNDTGELMLVTQGDNVPVPDHPILASQVEGRELTEVPLLGDISRAVDGKGGFFAYRSIVISIAVSWVAIWGLVTSSKASRRNNEPLDT
jgi:signal peptidase I